MALVSIPQAVLPSCNLTNEANQAIGKTCFNTASGITQLQQGSGDLEIECDENSFNTASGITQLQRQQALRTAMNRLLGFNTASGITQLQR